VLVQLADTVAGSIARSYRTGKADRREYRSVIEPRLEVWEFGRPEE
jgi:hypothetical protein